MGLVHSGKSGSTAATGLSVGAGNFVTPAAGNLLIMAVSQTGSAAKIVPGDNLGTTGWHVAETSPGSGEAAVGLSGAGANSVQIAYKVAVGTETSLTGGAGGTGQGVAYVEWNGLAATLDGNPVVTNNQASGKTITSPTLSTSQAGSVCFAAIGDGAAAFGKVSAWTPAGVATIAAAESARIIAGSYAPGTILTNQAFTGNWETARVSGLIVVAFLPVVHTHTLTASQPQEVSKAVAITRIPSASQPQSPTRIEALARSLSASQAQSAYLAKVLVKPLAVSQSQSIVRTRTIAQVKSLSISQPQSILRTTGVSRSLSVAQASGPSGPSGTSTVSRVLSTSQGQSASLSATIQRATTLSCSQGQSVTRTTNIGRNLNVAVAQTSSAVIARALSRSLTASQSQTPVLAHTKTLVESLSAATGSSASLHEVLDRPLRVSQPQVVTMHAAIAHSFVLSQPQSPTVASARARLFVASQPQAASIVRELAVNLGASASSSSTLEVLSNSTPITLTCEQPQAVVLSVALAHGLAVSQGAEAALESVVLEPTVGRMRGSASTEAATIAVTSVEAPNSSRVEPVPLAESSVS